MGDLNELLQWAEDEATPERFAEGEARQVVREAEAEPMPGVAEELTAAQKPRTGWMAEPRWRDPRTREEHVLRELAKEGRRVGLRGEFAIDEFDKIIKKVMPEGDAGPAGPRDKYADRFRKYVDYWKPYQELHTRAWGFVISEEKRLKKGVLMTGPRLIKGAMKWLHRKHLHLRDKDKWSPADLTPEQQRMYEMFVHEAASKSKLGLGEHFQRGLHSMGNRLDALGESVLQGIVGLEEGERPAITRFGAEERARGIMAAQRPEPGWPGRTAEMLPMLAAGIVTGSVSPAASHLLFSLEELPTLTNNLRDAGVSPEKAAVLGAVGAYLYGAIEHMQVKQLTPSIREAMQEMMATTWRGWAVEFAKGRAKTIAAETLEEGLQALSERVTVAAGRAWEGQPNEAVFKEAWAGVEDGLQDMWHAAGPMAFLSLAGNVPKGIRAAARISAANVAPDIPDGIKQARQLIMQEQAQEEMQKEEAKPPEQRDVTYKLRTKAGNEYTVTAPAGTTPEEIAKKFKATEARIAEAQEKGREAEAREGEVTAEAARVEAQAGEAMAGLMGAPAEVEVTPRPAPEPGVVPEVAPEGVPGDAFGVPTEAAPEAALPVPPEAAPVVEPEVTEPGTLMAQGKPVEVPTEYHRHPAAEEADEPTVQIDIAQLDAAWKAEDLGYYLGEGEGWQPGRTEATREFLSEMPRVTIDAEGKVGFVNGRHRFALLRDAGVETMPVSVDPEQAQALQAAIGVEAAPVVEPEVTGPAVPPTAPERPPVKAKPLPELPAEPTPLQEEHIMSEMAKIATRWGDVGQATEAEADWVFRVQNMAEPGSDMEGAALSMMKRQPPIERVAPEAVAPAKPAPEMVSVPRTAAEVGAEGEAAGTFRAPEAGVTAIGEKAVAALPPIEADRGMDPGYMADVRQALEVEEGSPEHEAFVREVARTFEGGPLGMQARGVLQRQYKVGALEEMMRRPARAPAPPAEARQVIPSARPATEAPLTPRDVEQAFPGSRVSRQTEANWRVQLPNGSAFNVQVGAEVPIDREGLRRDYGEAVANDPSIRVAGGWEFRMANEREGVTGLGVMKLAAGLADTTTLRHEAVHVARSAGLFTDAEWRNLTDRFAKDVPASQQEERVANALEQWQTEEPGLWEKIVDFFRRLAGAVGGETANDAIRALQTGAMWKRSVPDSGSTTQKAQVVYGRPDLANPAVEKEARALVDAVDEARKAKGLPGVLHDIDVQKEAQRRLEADYQTERQNIMTRGVQGISLTPEETLIAKELINREGTESIRSRNRNKIAEAVGITNAWRRVGTPAARAFRLRGDPLESPEQRTERMLLEALTTPRKDIARRLNKAIDAGDQAEALSIQLEWADKIEDIRKELLAMGYDIDNMDSIAADPVAAANMVRAISTAKADWWDAAYEFWISSILSAPTTQGANLIGNTAFATWDMFATRAVESLVNMGVQEPTGATWGEFRHLFAGFLPGMAQGARNFVMTYKTEMPWFEYEMGRERAGKLEGRGPKIKGRKGRIIRIPLRLLSAFDAWAKTTVARMEVGAQAYRIAKQENLSGPAMSQRIAELMADLKSPAWDAAVGEAQRLAFQQKGERLRKLMEARGKIPGIRYVMPFILTPSRIFQAGIRMSPVGLLKLAERTRHGLRTGDWTGITKRIAEQAIATTVMLALLNNDEDDPWITGAAKERKRGARVMARRTFPTQSIKVGGTWLSYSRIEPFATALSIAVDGMNSLKTGDPMKVAGASVDNILGQVKDKTFMRGLSDIMRATESQNTVEGVGRWAASFATSWVPNIVRAGLRSGKEYYPERGLWGRGGARAKRLLKRTWQRTELPGVPPEPSYDVWGRPARRHKGPMPGTDWLWRMTVPVRIQPEDIFIGDRVLLKWNNENPEDAYEPVPPNRYMRAKGKTIYFTDEEYADYARLSGERARALVQGLNLSPDRATVRDRDRISSAIIDGRAWARNRMKRKYRRLRGD